MTKILNIFYAKIVIAPVLDDTQNFLKESLISTYLTSTSLLFIERHDQFFVLKSIWTEMKVQISQNIASTTHITKGLTENENTSKRKRYLSALQGASPSLKNWGSPFLYSPEKLKASSSVLISATPPFPSSSSLCTPEEKQILNIQKLLLF